MEMSLCRREGESQGPATASYGQAGSSGDSHKVPLDPKKVHGIRAENRRERQYAGHGARAEAAEIPRATTLAGSFAFTHPGIRGKPSH